MTNETALPAIQAAMYSTLTSDAELDGDAGIYDHVPETATYPYVVIGDAVETPGNTHSNFGSRVTETLHIWSEYRGYLQALGVLAHLMRLLDHQQITIGGRQLVAVRHEQTVTMRDPDPDIRHIAVRFAVETFQS